MKHRIWRCDTCEYRELLSVTRNEYKDVVLTLDGGEVLQFTPRNDMPTPPLERIELAGRGRDSKTKELSEVAFIVLKNPRESFTGNIRVFTAARPPVDAVTTPTDNGKPKTKQRQAVTQSEAAKLCGVTEETIRRWEKGEGTPSRYPGRHDAVTLRAWAAWREEAANIKRGLTKMTIVRDMDRATQKKQHSDWQADMRRRGATGYRSSDY